MNIKGPSYRHKICLSLQQWSLLIAILVFVVTAILAICASLGRMHMQDAWELIEADLAEEQEKNNYESDQSGHLSPNEVKLRYSQQFVFAAIWMLHVGTWVCSVNLAGAIFMIYGIAVKSAFYILPWLLISSSTYVLGVATLLFGYLDMLPGLFISSYMLTTSLSFSCIFLTCWLIILRYHSVLTRTQRISCNPTSTPTTVQAHGGYTHTVKSSVCTEKKQAE